MSSLPGGGGSLQHNAGAKAIKKFKGLMLRRINWTEERKSEIEEEDQMDVEQTSVADNRCNLVWEVRARGAVTQRRNASR